MIFSLLLVFLLPYILWIVFKIDKYVPLAIIQILMGIILGPGLLGHFFPSTYDYFFNPDSLQFLNGISTLGIAIFVMSIGLETDFNIGKNEIDSLTTSILCFLCPFIFGCTAATIMMFLGFIESIHPVKLVLSVGLAISVTALPILSVILEKFGLKNTIFYNRVIKYASLDDFIIWSCLALILMDLNILISQGLYAIFLVLSGFLLKKIRSFVLKGDNRYYISLIFLLLSSAIADLVKLHFVFGAFIAGIIIGKNIFNKEEINKLRKIVSITMMPVFFILTGIRTEWSIDNYSVVIIGITLLVIAVSGKLFGAYLSGKIFRWGKGESYIIGWLLQTKALIEIIYIQIMFDYGIFNKDLYCSFMLMAIGSTILTMPAILSKKKNRIFLEKMAQN